MNTLPPINIQEQKHTYKIVLSTHGLNKKDFNIYTEGNTLTIACKNKPIEKTNNFSSTIDDYYLYRSITLPDNADRDGVTAKYNGSLKLNIPKIRLKKKK